MPPFQSLHVRSCYAPLRSTCRLPALVERAKTDGSAVCVTDPNLWAVAKVAKLAKEVGVPQIVGMEYTPAGLRGHLVLLARSTQGWRDLRAIASADRLLTLEELVGGGLLREIAVLTGGARGALCQSLRHDPSGDEAQEAVLAPLSEAAHGAVGSVCVELAPTMGDDAAPGWRRCWELANGCDLDVVATSDASYMARADASAWHVLRAIAEKRRVDQRELRRIHDFLALEGHPGLRGGSDHRGVPPPDAQDVSARWGRLATEAEIVAYFADCPAAVENARRLAGELAGAVDLGLGRVAMPDYVDDEGRTLDAGQQMRQLAAQASVGLDGRLRQTGALHNIEVIYRQRLDEELEVIKATGFAGYFLIFADFVRWAKENGIPCGPGRGSASGSLAVWSLGITGVDPIRHGLLFERFLNAARCFPGHTRVLTRRGWVRIDNVTIMDWVWTRHGWRRVLKKMSRFVDEDLVKISTRHGSLTATTGHGIFLNQQGYLHKTAIEEIEEGDELSDGRISLCDLPKDRLEIQEPGGEVLFQEVHVRRPGCDTKRVRVPGVSEEVHGVCLQTPQILFQKMQEHRSERGVAATKAKKNGEDRQRSNAQDQRETSSPYSRSDPHATKKSQEDPHPEGCQVVPRVQRGVHTQVPTAEDVFSQVRGTKKQAALSQKMRGLWHRICRQRTTENLFQAMRKVKWRLRGLFIWKEGVQRRHTTPGQVGFGGRLREGVQIARVYGGLRAGDLCSALWKVVSPRFLGQGDGPVLRVEGVGQRPGSAQCTTGSGGSGGKEDCLPESGELPWVRRDQHGEAERSSSRTDRRWDVSSFQEGGEDLPLLQEAISGTGVSKTTDVWEKLCQPPQKATVPRNRCPLLVVQKEWVRFSGLVWNLSVDLDHEYVAEGILVTNCSLPDIDQDFCKRRRGEVVEYLRTRYGANSVGKIINYKVLQGKTALKDVGRAFGVGFGRLNAITTGVPQTVEGKTPRLAWMLEHVPALAEAVRTDPVVKEVVRYAQALEDCVRESGVHASGIVLSRGPLSDWLPTCRVGTKKGRSGDLCSQWSMDEVEAAGLVKFDLLGLSTMTHIHLAEEMINEGNHHARREGYQGGHRGVREPAGMAAGDTEHRGRARTRGRPAGSRQPGHGQDNDGSGGDSAFGDTETQWIEADADRRGDHGVLVGDSGNGVREAVAGPVHRREFRDVGGNDGDLERQERSPDQGRRGDVAEDRPQHQPRTAGGDRIDVIGGHDNEVCSDRPRFRVADLPLDDAATFRTIAAADTLGVFQLGKGGMRRMLLRLRPDCFGDVAAATALYRPGPMKSGMMDDYIERKHGRRRVEYLHPLVEEATKETHGSCIYQETLMSLIRSVAGYSLGESDRIRKIVGKKRKDLLEKERSRYFAAVKKHGVCDDKVAKRVWEIVEANSSYSFNRAHSVSYGLLSYQTAYLKTHYPLEFFAAWLSSLCDETDKFVKIKEAVYDLRARGIEVLPPDVNKSEKDFTISDDE